MQIVCIDENDCNPRPPTSPNDMVDIEMITSSDSFCGETQLIEVHGEIVILSNPTECNGRLNASVICYPGEDSEFPNFEFALESVTLLQVRAGPHVAVENLPGDAQQSENDALIVYNRDVVAPFDFTITSSDDNSVTFNFIWLAEYLQCQTSQALIEVEVQVDYLATRDLTLLETERLLLSFDGEGRFTQSRKLLQDADPRDRAIYLAGSTNILADPSTSAEREDNGDDSSALPAWVIAIIAVLATGLCCLVVVGAIFFMYFKKKKDARTSDGQRRSSEYQEHESENAEEIEVQPVASSGKTAVTADS